MGAASPGVSSDSRGRRRYFSSGWGAGEGRRTKLTTLVSAGFDSSSWARAEGVARARARAAVTGTRKDIGRVLGVQGAGVGEEGRMVDGRWSMVDGRWSMVDGRWPMVDGRWPMVD